MLPLWSYSWVAGLCLYHGKKFAFYWAVAGIWGNTKGWKWPCNLPLYCPVTLSNWFKHLWIDNHDILTSQILWVFYLRVKTYNSLGMCRLTWVGFLFCIYLNVCCECNCVTESVCTEISGLELLFWRLTVAVMYSIMLLRCPVDCRESHLKFSQLPHSSHLLCKNPVVQAAAKHWGLASEEDKPEREVLSELESKAESLQIPHNKGA